MSTLSDLYNAMETLHKVGLSLSEDQEKQVSELEAEIIKKDILPIVTQSIEPALQQVKRELVLVVDYIPGTPISVRLSRKRNLTDGIKDAIEILPDPPVEHKNIGSNKAKRVMSNVTRLKITFNDGRIINKPKASETFFEFVKQVGPERIRTLGLKQNKVPLVSNTLDEKYKQSQKHLGNGWYLITHSCTNDKKSLIEKIAKAFGIKVKVEVT